jgi:hypothetical protein
LREDRREKKPYSEMKLPETLHQVVLLDEQLQQDLLLL